MAKNVLLKMSLCLAASFVITGTAKAQTIDSDQGIAGLSYKIDQYFKVYDETISDKFDLEVQSLDNEEVSEDSIARTVSEDTAKKAEKKTKKAKKAKKEESKFANMGISIAESYVRVRKKASTDSEVMGKLYQGCVADIVKYEGDWVKIKSGKVEGYIMSEYLAIGKDAEDVVDQYVSKTATVTTTTLKVRDKKTTESMCLTQIPMGETYDVIKEYKDWVRISIDDDDIKGYVSKDYVDVKYDFQHAISIEEEKAKLAAEEAAKKAEEERLAELAAQQRAEEERKQQAAQQQQQQSRPSSSSSSSNNSSSSNSRPSSSSSSNSGSSSSAGSSSGRGTGSAVASYAQRFVGNPYVWGGTSLTNGTDCSGFVQSVYRNYGYTLPRTSGAQSRSGSAVSVSSLQPGDIVYYANGGSVNHVAIYIGGGKVVHASNRRDGIKISSYNYRTPAGARRVAR